MKEILQTSSGTWIPCHNKFIGKNISKSDKIYKFSIYSKYVKFQNLGPFPELKYLILSCNCQFVILSTNKGGQINFSVITSWT